jgi:hypothetical protein
VSAVLLFARLSSAFFAAQFLLCYDLVETLLLAAV